MQIATWNLRCIANGAKTIQFLDRTPWDMACLQEVNPAATQAIHERGWSAINGLELAWEEEYKHWKRLPHAAAVVARNGWSLKGGTMPDTPKPGRGIVAEASKEGSAFSVISWHAPNASGEGVETKMAGYKAMIAAVNSVEGPLVAGLDTNHWSLEIDLDPQSFDAADPFAVENQFFSDDPQHRLRDALVDYLKGNPIEYEAIKQARPTGPLAVTHRRRGTNDRFDYIMVSDEFAVTGVDHLWEENGVGGSDHGLVRANLELRG